MASSEFCCQLLMLLLPLPLERPPEGRRPAASSISAGTDRSPDPLPEAPLLPRERALCGAEVLAGPGLPCGSTGLVRSLPAGLPVALPGPPLRRSGPVAPLFHSEPFWAEALLHACM